MNLQLLNNKNRQFDTSTRKSNYMDPAAEGTGYIFKYKILSFSSNLILIVFKRVELVNLVHFKFQANPSSFCFY